MSNNVKEVILGMAPKKRIVPDKLVAPELPLDAQDIDAFMNKFNSTGNESDRHNKTRAAGPTTPSRGRDVPTSVSQPPEPSGLPEAESGSGEDAG